MPPSEISRILCAEHMRFLDEAAGRLLSALSRGLIPLTLDSIAVLYAHPNSTGQDKPGGLTTAQVDQLVMQLAGIGLLRTHHGAQRPLYSWDPSVSLRDNLPPPLEAKSLAPPQQVDLIWDLTAAALSQEAFSLYTRLSRWLLMAGEHRLGERATRAFMNSGDVRRFTEGLSAQQEGVVLSDHGVFLHGLGQLDAAIRVQELSRERDWQNPRDLAWDDFRLASVQISRGTLRAGREILADICKRSCFLLDENLAVLVYSRYAEATTLAGDLRGARELLERAGESQHVGLKGLHGAPALAYVEFLLRQDKMALARSVILGNLDYCRHWHRDSDVLVSFLQLAEVEMRGSRYGRALVYIRRARRASEAKGWQEVLCRSFALGGRVCLVASRDLDARAELTNGLEIAKRCGFALLEADLLLGLSELTVKTDKEGSKRYARRAVEIAQSCGYKWPVRSGRKLVQRIAREEP